jgi:vacuolar-type H+-ATPase subunit I/STV1
MLFRFGAFHRTLGWVLSILGLVAVVAGARGYVTDAPVNPSLLFGGLLAVVVGTSLVRWARRARPS